MNSILKSILDIPGYADLKGLFLLTRRQYFPGAFTKPCPADKKREPNHRSFKKSTLSKWLRGKDSTKVGVSFTTFQHMREIVWSAPRCAYLVPFYSYSI